MASIGTGCQVDGRVRACRADAFNYRLSHGWHIARGLKRPRFEIGRMGGVRLRRRQRGTVTQAKCFQAQWRLLVAGLARCSHGERHKRGLAQQQQGKARRAGRVGGVLSRASHPIQSHHISRRPRTRRKNSLTTTIPTSLPIPFRHIGPCSAACSALPGPCCEPEFPLSLPIAQAAQIIRTPNFTPLPGSPSWRSFPGAKSNHASLFCQQP